MQSSSRPSLQTAKLVIVSVKLISPVYIYIPPGMVCPLMGYSMSCPNQMVMYDIPTLAIVCN